MNYFPDKTRDIPAFIFMHLLVLLGAYVLIIVAVKVWTERECLVAGYPKAKITVVLDRYCLDLVGGTVRVDALSKVKLMQAPESSKPEKN